MTHAPWSSEMPRLPAMCGIETFAIVRSSTTMKLLSASTMPARYRRLGAIIGSVEGNRGGGAVATGSVAGDVDLDFHRQPDPQRMRRQLLGIELDPYRHALHDLDPVARRVLRRDQGLGRSGAAGDPCDPAVEHDVAAVDIGGHGGGH